MGALLIIRRNHYVIMTVELNSSDLLQNGYLYIYTHSMCPKVAPIMVTTQPHSCFATMFLPHGLICSTVINDFTYPTFIFYSDNVRRYNFVFFSRKVLDFFCLWSYRLGHLSWCALCYWTRKLFLAKPTFYSSHTRWLALT